ncbi:MAG: DUF945 family protein, partial [Proteobacteria bacterium]|nr:DUF945 family protein [Pseudomonadota bacterium]
MNKILILLLITILPIAVIAEPKTDDMVNLSMQHRINGNDFLPKETLSLSSKKLKSDPSLLLQFVRNSLSNHLHTLPVQISTNLEFSDKLPTIVIETKVDKNSNGVSDVTIPAYQISKDKILVNWKGISSHLTFTGNFINLKADTNFDGITITGKDKLLISLAKIDIHSAFDTKFKPTKLKIDLPSFKAQEDKNELNMQSFMTNIDVKKLTNGLEIINLAIQLKHINFVESDIKAGLKNLRLTTDIQEHDDVISFNLETTADKVNLPTDIATGLENIT